MSTRFRVLLSSVIFLLSANLSAENKITYKWTDDEGEVHYTERPPKTGEYTKIITHVDKSSVVKTAPKPVSQPEAEEKKDSYGTWRDDNCKIANQNLDILQNAARISVDDGQGGKQLMSDEQKQEKIAQMEKQRDKYCNPEK